MNKLKHLWICFLAFFRLSEQAVCEASKGKSYVDYHDYHDSDIALPEPFTLHKCKRCDKTFTI